MIYIFVCGLEGDLNILKLSTKIILLEIHEKPHGAKKAVCVVCVCVCFVGSGAG